MSTMILVMIDCGSAYVACCLLFCVFFLIPVLPSLAPVPPFLILCLSPLPFMLVPLSFLSSQKIYAIVEKTNLIIRERIPHHERTSVHPD